MSKKQDLLLVFEFLAEFLREDSKPEPKLPKLIVETPEPISRITVNRIPATFSSGLDQLLNTGNVDIFGQPSIPIREASSEHILNIMKKLDDMDKSRATAIQGISNEDRLRRSLQNQLSDLRNEHITKLVEDTVEEEKAFLVKEEPAEIHVELETEYKPKYPFTAFNDDKVDLSKSSLTGMTMTNPFFGPIKKRAPKMKPRKKPLKGKK